MEPLHMVPYATTAGHHPTTPVLPLRLQGPHPACAGLGCPPCLRTGLACVRWVTYEREQERRAAEMFGTALAHDLADAFDKTAADIIRAASRFPRDNSRVIDRVARMVEEHCWLLHGHGTRVHTAVVAHA